MKDRLTLTPPIRVSYWVFWIKNHDLSRSDRDRGFSPSSTKITFLIDI